MLCALTKDEYEYGCNNTFCGASEKVSGIKTYIIYRVPVLIYQKKFWEVQILFGVQPLLTNMMHNVFYL